MKNSVKIIFILLTILLLFGCSQETILEDNKETILEVPDEGPYWDKLLFSSSESEKWPDDAPTIIEHASVADAITLTQDIGNFKAGNILTVFVFFKENIPVVQDIGLLYSEDDGNSWSELFILNVVNPDSHAAVDPSLVQLDNGNLVLYYLDFSVAQPGSQNQEYTFYAATSEDGLNYNLENAIFSSTEISTDPDVIFYNGQWLMYYAKESDETMHVLTGTNHLNFENDQTTGIKGIPGTLIVEDELHLYGCGGVEGEDGNGITISKSMDGITFTSSALAKMGDCDPAPVILENGNFGLIYKDHIE